MKMKKNCLTTFLLLIALFIANIAMAASTDSTRVIRIEATNQMRFSITHIFVKPGQKIKVELTTVSNFPANAMSHDFVLLKAGVDPSKVAKLSLQYANKGYIAPETKDQIIAYTSLASGGKTVSITFKVPNKPGNYTYICTFPGHFLAGMKGILTVK